MKIIKNITATKDEYIQIYADKKEYEDESMKQEFEKYKQFKVAIFVNGNKNYIPIIKQIINTSIAKQNDTCYTTDNMKNKSLAYQKE